MLFEKIIAGCCENHKNYVIQHGVKGRAVRRVRILEKKKPIPLYLYVHLSACISSAPSARIFVKFDARDFHLNLCKKEKSEFGYIWAKVSDTSHEDVQFGLLMPAT